MYGHSKVENKINIQLISRETSFNKAQAYCLKIFQIMLYSIVELLYNAFS